jgi:tetratricopeptide (TPR) repeat protein
LIAIDFTQRSEWILLEVFRRAAFVLAMVAGLGLTTLKSMSRQEIDDRPAPWIYVALLVAITLFLLHNLIDFSLFEPGTMSIFALLLGAALGMRLPYRSRRRWGTAVVIAVYILGGVAWFTAAGAGFWSIAQAEQLAADADDIIRTNGNVDDACTKYVQAANLVPIDGDYSYRAALISPAAAEQLLEKAIAADPLSVRNRRALAELNLKLKQIDLALKQFAECVALDPNNMDLRLEYADALRDNRRFDEARAQYEQVLRINDALPKTEIQRLPDAKSAYVRDQLAKLKT